MRQRPSSAAAARSLVTIRPGLPISIVHLFDVLLSSADRPALQSMRVLSQSLASRALSQASRLSIAARRAPRSQTVRRSAVTMAAETLSPRVSEFGSLAGPPAPLMWHTSRHIRDLAPLDERRLAWHRRPPPPLAARQLPASLYYHASRLGSGALMCPRAL